MRSSIVANALALVWAAWRRRYLIAVPIIVMPVVAVLVGVLSPKKYETYTTILIQEAAKQNPFLEDLTVETNLRDRMDALLTLLHSRHVLGEVAATMGLISAETSGEEATKKIAKLSLALKASLVGDDLVKISYQADSPEHMADILKLVSIRFVERIIAPQRSSISNSERFLKDELNRRKVDLTTSEQLLADYKTKFAGELPNLHTTNIIQLANLREDLVHRRTDLEGAEAEWEGLQSRLFRTNPVVGEIEERIVKIMSELIGLRSRYTDRHSKVQATVRTLKRLEDERAKVLAATKNFDSGDIERLWNMAATISISGESERPPLLIGQLERLQVAEGQVKSLTQQVTVLEHEITEIERKVSGFGGHERRLGELERDLSVQRKVFEDLSERYEMARVTGSLGKAEEKERVKLIDPPFTPLAPTNLPLTVYVIFGVFAGLVLGVGMAVCAELLDLTIRLRSQVERLTGAPTLTRIPPLIHESLLSDENGPLAFSAKTGTFISRGLTHA